jgi:hypothetical protein
MKRGHHLMNTDQILNELRTELGRIEQAIAALEALDGNATPEPPNPKVPPLNSALTN